jgi:tetratricopeptide (TPR) repeat protein
VVASATTWQGCGEEVAEEIPITTSSERARELYVQGRDLHEGHRIADARQLYEQALAADPEFALAHYALALSSPRRSEFLEHLRAAVDLAYKVSDAERWMILGLEAGNRQQLATQRGYYNKLVEAYPGDKRAHMILGNFHFALQEYELALESLERATEIDPEYAPPYNMIGYAQRLLGNDAAAEQAFKKYIELIPDEPNPYDSYAEFLMRVGRFDESIDYYRKALEIEPHFVPSYVGIAHNQMLEGDFDAARSTLAGLADVARSENERRAANLWLAVSYLHQEDYDSAIAAMERNYAIAEKGNELSTMAQDLGTIGDFLREAGRLDEAAERYEQSAALMQRADEPVELKAAAERGLIFARARLALQRGDIDEARAKAELFRQRAEVSQVPYELRAYHALLGLIALEEEDYDSAVEELESANQRDPVVLFALCRALHGRGDDARAREVCEQAYRFNQLGVGYAYVRNDARRLLEQL